MTVETTVTTVSNGGDGGGGTTSSETTQVSVRPVCWYEQTNLSGADMAARIGPEGAHTMVESGLESYASHAAEDGRWYRATCDPHADPEALKAEVRKFWMVTRRWRWVPAGQEPPAPVIDARTLVRAAMGAVRIPVPEVETNPRVTTGDGVSGATVVGLDTWVWATGETPSQVRVTASAGSLSATVVASASGSPWAGLLAAPPAGILVALLLALFGLKYRVNQIVVGVVLNVLVSGLTGFLFSTVLSDSGSLNRAMRLPRLPVPGLSHVPVLGPVLFNQTILVYAMYAAVGILSLMLFRSRWGLRMRAVGEHPRAADTVGIAVMRTRVNNLVLGGALAGLGGAFFTVGSGLSFTKGISAGNGYIALAAMILGAWNPLGTLWAALLFGFATSVGQTLSVIGSPIPTNFILMIPYVVTILAVAGFVGRVRPPAAEGVPYP